MKIYNRTGPRIMLGLLPVLVLATAMVQHSLSMSPESVWAFVYINIELFISIMILFAVIVAAGNISEEFSKGTIKLLLIRPVSRSKILLSKYMASLLFSLGMLVVTFAFSLLIGGMFFGFDAPSQTSIMTMDGSQVEQVIPHLLSTIALVYVDMTMMVTIAFTISTVFRNSTMAIGFTIFLRFIGPNVVIALQQYDWTKYILFAHLNLRQHIGGAAYVEGLTMTFSVTTLFVYFCIFVALAWLIFNKRDVAA